MAKNKIIAGAAIGTLLGSLALALFPRRKEIVDAIMDQGEEFTDKAKEYAQLLLDKGRNLANFRVEEEDNSAAIWSGVAGLILGAGAALFMAPKTGKQLRNQAIKTYNELFGKTKSVINVLKNSSHPFIPVTRSTAHKATHHNGTQHPVKRTKRLIKTKH